MEALPKLKATPNHSYAIITTPLQSEIILFNFYINLFIIIVLKNNKTCMCVCMCAYTQIRYMF